LPGAARRLLLGASLLVASSGCQVLLGDFAVDDPQPTAPAALGEACDPDAVRCNGDLLETCSSDRRGWQALGRCANADQCDPGAAACRPCTAGEFACNGAALESCDALQRWQPAGACESPELCQVSADRGSGACLAPVCQTPGALECDGNRLVRCSRGRERLTLVERCASPELCDADRANADEEKTGRGTCVPATCLLGTFACDGAALSRCRDDQSGWEPVETCADAQSCNPRTGTCAACSPPDTACSGVSLLRCAASGFELVATCDAPELCDPAAGRCNQTECHSPGAVRCVTGDLTSLEECGNDGRWAVREACATRALCSESAAHCLAPACQSGDGRCVGAVHQSCAPDLTRWVADDTCGSQETCTPTGCQAAGCSEGSYRCNLASLEQCVAGVWLPQVRCASSVLCNADAHGCEAPTCGGTLGDFECDGQILRQCTPGREWTEFLTCTGTKPVCDIDPVIGTGRPSCDVCEPLAYSCAANELHRCTADGTAAPRLRDCPGGCTIAGDGAPTCAE